MKVCGDRGPPALDGAEFLGCLAAIRGQLEGVRWHYRWELGPGDIAWDGLRVEFSHGSPGMASLMRALEGRIPPPDHLVAEPLQTELDLDDVQSEAEMGVCLDLLWRYSVFMAELRARNPRLTTSSYRDLTPSALLTFVTGDRRHLEAAMGNLAVTNIPSVAFGRAVGLIREARLRYHLPPADPEDACAAARIHHLTACTFGSSYYPFRRAG